MAVTELAILRLLNSSNLFPSLLQTLHTAKLAMEASSKLNFNFYHCIEDPHLIFIIGAWPSVSYHMDVFIPSPENKQLLKFLEGQMTVETMFHVDVDPSDTFLSAGMEVVTVGRYTVGGGKKKGFEEAYGLAERGMVRFNGGDGGFEGGWRIDGLDEKNGLEEFVLFTGWASGEKHARFKGDVGWVDCDDIKEFVEGVDVKHARLLDVSEGGVNV